MVTAKNVRLSVVEHKEGSPPPSVGGRPSFGANAWAAWALVAQRPAEGGELWSQPLPAEPVRWGLAVDAQGRVIVALRNGQIICFGK